MKEILKMPNVKLPERLQKIKLKITNMVSDRDEAYDYVKQMELLRIKQLSKSLEHNMLELNSIQAQNWHHALLKKQQNLNRNNAKVEMASWRHG